MATAAADAAGPDTGQGGATAETDSSRLIAQRHPAGWLVRYGEGLQHCALFLDRSAAERSAVTLHGQIAALYEWPAP